MPAPGRISLRPLKRLLPPPPVGTFDNNAAYQALTPEKQAKYNEIVKSAEEAMLPLREKMMAKRLQLDTMASMPNMNEEAIAKAAAEVASLHTQMITT